MDRLSTTVRPYAWGSTTAIPDLLGVPPTGKPQAEIWMGDHPGAPSRLTRGGAELPLSDVISADPVRELGQESVGRFGPHLPFLLKVLAADSPLSLQVHPDLSQAKDGFAEEERRGVPVDAPDRNYKDANHKPELICALTPFDGLCGFRAPADAAGLLAGLGVDALAPHIDALRTRPAATALRDVLTALLTGDAEQNAATVTQVADAAERLGGPYAPYAEIARHYPGDPGVIAAMLLNHVRLQPGEAMFLGAGVPHAYLKGLGVEIMANSDNVLRCGLTPKHVDVPELLRVVRFEATEPALLRPEPGASGEQVFATPVDDFRLSRFERTADAPPADVTSPAAQILLCTAGTPHADGITLAPGDSVFVPAGEQAELTGAGTVFRATVAI